MPSLQYLKRPTIFRDSTLLHGLGPIYGNTAPDHSPITTTLKHHMYERSKTESVREFRSHKCTPKAQVSGVRGEHKIHHCRELASPSTLSRRSITTPRPVPRTNIICGKPYAKRPHTRDDRSFAGIETDDQICRRADEADNCNKMGFEIGNSSRQESSTHKQVQQQRMTQTSCNRQQWPARPCHLL